MNDFQKVEALDFDTLHTQLTCIFKTDGDITNFINFMKNINKFTSLSNDKRHMVLVDLGYFKSQISKYERQIQSFINKKKHLATKNAISEIRKKGEKLTDNLVQYYLEEDTSLDSLEELHNIVLAWKEYMTDLVFVCNSSYKLLGGFN